MIFQHNLNAYLNSRSSGRTSTVERFFSYLESEDFSFKQQRDFIMSDSLNIANCCSRRSGKTIGVQYKSIRTGITKKNSNIVYLTDTRGHAKGLMWEPMIELCEKLKIPIHQRVSELKITFKDTGSSFWLAGADNEKQVKKLLGYKLTNVYIDEAQGFPGFLETMCVDKILPALEDVQGQLVLTGTPNMICAGYFYDCVHSKDWDVHGWTCWENPFFVNGIRKLRPDLHTIEDLQMNALKRSGKDINDPGVRREWFGEWVRSEEYFVYEFDPNRNTYEHLDQNEDWKYVIGVDLGVKGSDAIAVLGWRPFDQTCYVVEEYKNSGMTTEKLTRFVRDLQKKYKPVNTVLDEGGLGSRTNLDFAERYGTYLDPAQKTQKYSYIKMLNSELVEGLLKSPRGGMLQTEMTALRWCRKALENFKYEEDTSTHNHICDAVLYAWRWSRSNLIPRDIVKDIPRKGSKERAKYDRDSQLKSILGGPRSGWARM